LGGAGFSKPSSTSKIGGFGSHAATGGLGALGGFAAGKLSNKGSKGTSSALGGGGFTKPSSTSKIGGFGSHAATGGLGALGGFAAGKLSNRGSKGKSSTLGGGGFGSLTGSSGGFTKPSSSSSKLGGFGSHAATGGLGALGGFAAGKLSNKGHKGYSYPKSSQKFTSIFKKKPKTYSSPGYGTAWGTKFTPETKYKQKKGFSKKALGLGVAAGFLGGAAVGVAGTKATYGVYHRYKKFKNMMTMRGFGHRRSSYHGSSHHGYDYDYDDGGFFGPTYYNNYYNSNQCFGGCYGNSHCEWGFCECNYGYQRRYGQCRRAGAVYTPRPQAFDPFASCATNDACQTIDINMVCNTKLTTQLGGKCQCKPDMRWNKQSGECQLFMDVDCSSFTYDSAPSQLIQAAVAKAQAQGINPNMAIDELNRTPTIQESMGGSLLSQLDANQAGERDLREAYCRDVDSFSFDLNVDDGMPPRCEPVPRQACGVVYESGSCNSGWKLIISEGEISFPYFSDYYKYRNDIETIGVKAGCTLTAFSNTGFSNQRGTLRADDMSDRWWVLRDYAEFLHLDNDIESIQCVCRQSQL